jgi:hypothetical protein
MKVIKALWDRSNDEEKTHHRPVAGRFRLKVTPSLEY